jgi:hypothetical protein
MAAKVMVQPRSAIETHLYVLFPILQQSNSRLRGRTHHVRIEVWIEDNNSVCAPEVDSHSAGAGAQQVDKHVRAWAIELVHVLLSLSLFGRAILEYKFFALAEVGSHMRFDYQAKVLESFATEKVFHNVQRDDKLSTNVECAFGDDLTSSTHLTKQ